MTDTSPDSLVTSTEEETTPILEEILQSLSRLTCDQAVEDCAQHLLSHMPRTVLHDATPERMAIWLQHACQMVLERQQPFDVLLEQVDQGDHWYLITRSSDAFFLFDSVQNLLLRKGLSFRVYCHPVLTIAGEEGRIGPFDANKGDEHQSLVWIEIEGLGVADARRLRQAVDETLEAVGVVHRCRPAMLSRLRSMADVVDPDNAELIEWLVQGNFVPTSYRLVTQQAEQQDLVIDCSQNEGLATRLDAYLEGGCGPLNLPDHLKLRFQRKAPVFLEELAAHSPFHRSEHLSCVGFREPNGRGWKDHLFYGFFTQKAQDEVTSSIAALRQRIDAVLAELHIARDSHDYVKAIEIINAFPKVELFLMSDDQLREVVNTFPRFYRHEGAKLVMMPRLSPNRLTLVMILPKGFYDSDNTNRVEHFLERHFATDTVSLRVIHVSKNYLSLHVHIDTLQERPSASMAKLETALTRITLPWPQLFRRQLESQDPESAFTLWQKFVDSFDESYRSHMHPRYAVRDVRNLGKLQQTGQEQFDLWGPFQEGEKSYYRLQFYSFKQSYLNDLMPLLENLLLSVLEEIDFDIEVDGTPLYIKSFAVRFDQNTALDMASLREGLLATLTAMRSGAVENDTLHKLQPLTGLTWPQVDIFRAYRNYYFQLGTPFTKTRVAQALVDNPQVATLLYRYFEGRFQPDGSLEDAMEREEKKILPVRLDLAKALQAVDDINEDRILRTLFNLIDSTVRTNFYQRVDSDDYFVSFKISALGVIEMPAPRPLFEVYVHSATMEGIHLRGGKVARGGIRWSDRPDDFRTEVLGLMKAQMTKNAVIVPVGSKGGFVVKTPFSSREEGGRLSREAYITLMRGLLDLTDNRVKDQIIRPKGIIAYDEEDPYLVVAADKGTAHLPDTANGVSADYGFWLGDAFASGGSHGYDHKVQGITARGAWESVRRHFREMGHDTQTEPFTVVGIGDMSGDVFGNGMLLSQQIKLIAAFNHRHIFIDPDPDPAISYRERKRLFELAGSSWTDYSAELISAGGGVFDRASKEIAVSPQMADLFDIRHQTINGEELIRKLLMAPVDLLWNGGIGTYVRASTESDDLVGDRANDAVRIDATQLQAKVVGEGGNLGMTQLGRIECAMRGCALNTDALDNSGGVDCSDHEVNIKIFMQTLIQQGILSGIDQAHREVEAVTLQVNELVLRNNYTQSLCISLDRLRCLNDSEPFIDLMGRLTGSGLLDAQSEQLPAAKKVRAREDGAFVRPELFVLMAYSKMQLYRNLLESDLPDDEGIRSLLYAYFPEGTVTAFEQHIPDHPLHREIIATMLTNQVIDQGGSTLWQKIGRLTGASSVEVARTYLFFDWALQGRQLRDALFALDTQIPAEKQYALLLTLERAIEKMCIYVLDHEVDLSLKTDCLATYQQQIAQYQNLLSSLLPAEKWQQCKEQAQKLIALGMKDEPAARCSTLAYLDTMLPLFALAKDGDDDLYTIMRTFSEVQKRVGFDEMARRISQVPLQDRWDRGAAEALQRSLEATVLRLTRTVLDEAKGNPDTYLSQRPNKWRAYRSLRDGLAAVPPRNFHPYTVALRALEALIPQGE